MTREHSALYFITTMTATTSSSFLPQDFLQRLLDQMDTAAAEGVRWGFNLLWDALSPYWFYGILILFALFAIASVKFLFGQWSMLGSLIYHFVYFGVLTVIIVIMGVEVLLNPYFDLVYATLYPISYLLTGSILQRLRGV